MSKSYTQRQALDILRSIRNDGDEIFGPYNPKTGRREKMPKESEVGRKKVARGMRRLEVGLAFLGVPPESYSAVVAIVTDHVAELRGAIGVLEVQMDQGVTPDRGE